jgi:hypothetical protein
MKPAPNPILKKSGPTHLYYYVIFVCIAEIAGRLFLTDEQINRKNLKKDAIWLAAGKSVQHL